MKLYIRNVSELATPKGKCARHGKEMSELTVIHGGAVLIQDGIIAEVGTTAELDGSESVRGAEVLDASGKTLLPGFVDSHTHFLFGGYRAEEFSWRLKGNNYLSIMERGGGINATIQPTKAATEEELFQVGKQRLDLMLSYGVTTVEGKSGYGMDHDCELKMLRVMQALKKAHPISLHTTFLGAHSVLPEYKERRREFLTYLLREVMPEVKREGLAEFADIFCDQGVFTADEALYYLQESQKMGFKVKIHADEIAAIGASSVAAKVHAVSADHLLKATDEAIREMAEAGVITTLLPLTAFCLNEPYAPARKMIDSGCAVALASDLNPGSCFSCNIALLIALACIYMKMSIEEVITALTLNGAAALGRAEEIGSIEKGKQADLVLLSYPSIAYLPYHTAVNTVDTVIKAGKIVVSKH